MRPIIKDLTVKLSSKNIRPSIQRVKVLDYLLKNQSHPTVEQIFRGLQNEIPTLSKTTIYNTLNLFVKSGLVKVLTIEDNETRYDIITESHGHFKCEECGSIFNFRVDIDLVAAEDLCGFEINDRNVYFKGFCPHCLININNQRKEQIS
jgi:Fur family transcriptional regulator, peroxide stress response regulator